MTEISSTLWQLNNHSHHFVINSGANVDVALDYVNLLESDEELTSVSVTTTSGTLTVHTTYPMFDQSTRFGLEHQLITFLQPSAVGTHNCTATAETNRSRRFVHNFSILTPE